MQNFLVFIVHLKAVVKLKSQNFSKTTSPKHDCSTINIIISHSRQKDIIDSCFRSSNSLLQFPWTQIMLLYQLTCLICIHMKENLSKNFYMSRNIFLQPLPRHLDISTAFYILTILAFIHKLIRYILMNSKYVTSVLHVCFIVGIYTEHKH